MTTPIAWISDRFLTRRSRRALIVGMVAALAAGVWIGPEGAGAVRPLGVLAILLLTGAMLALVVVLHMTHHSATNPASLLDERGQSVRARAYELSYRILCGVFIAGFLYLHIVPQRLGPDWWPEGYSEWSRVAGVFSILLVVLPAAVIAWREPDVEPGEPEADAPPVFAGKAIGPIHRSILMAAVVVSVLLIVAQLAGITGHKPGFNYVVAGFGTGCLINLLLNSGVGRRTGRS